jgi:hypothetical protein
MNKEIKERWLTALRSGEYNQTDGFLKNGNAFCCLGVLCDLHRKETLDTAWQKQCDGEYDYLGQTELPPACVYEWAELPNVRTIQTDPGLANSVDRLVLANDEGESFDQIADMIEEEL